MLQTLLTHKLLIGFVLLLALLAAGLFWRSRRSRQSAAIPAHDDLYAEDYLEEPAYARRRSSRGQETQHPPLLDDVVLIDDSEPAPPPEKTGPGPKELIVVFFIESLEDGVFNGPELLAALEKNGLRHGDMRIFHHYGLEQGKGRPVDPVFSIADMLEPGIFDPAAMDDFTTRGLAMFMRLPGPLSGRVAFELMLSHAHRLAESLRGVLKDETHAPLTAEKIASLRHGIETFEQQRAE
jgi:cell division protein ZipA